MTTFTAAYLAFAIAANGTTWIDTTLGWQQSLAACEARAEEMREALPDIAHWGCERVIWYGGW